MLVSQRAASRRLSSRMAAVAVFLGTSAVLTVWWTVAVFNVVLRREGASVVQHQIHMLMETSRQIAATMLSHVDGCTAAAVNSVKLRVLTNSLVGSFPEARVSLQISAGEQSRVPDRQLEQRFRLEAGMAAWTGIRRTGSRPRQLGNSRGCHGGTGRMRGDIDF